MNRKQKYPEPDITIRLYGPPGSGKSSLIGDIADMLQSYGCEVICLEGPVGGPKRRRQAQAPGRFLQPRVVKIVEQHGE